MFLKYWITLCIHLILGTIILFYNTNEITLLHIIDALFYVTAIIMIIFLYLFILKGKFFDGVMYGMREFLKKTKKDNDHTMDDRPLPSETVNDHTYRLFKYQFLTFLVLLVILLVIYFLR